MRRTFAMPNPIEIVFNTEARQKRNFNLDVVPESKIGVYCERSINQVSAKYKKRIYISKIYLSYLWI